MTGRLWPIVLNVMPECVLVIFMNVENANNRCAIRAGKSGVKICAEPVPVRIIIEDKKMKPTRRKSALVGFLFLD